MSAHFEWTKSINFVLGVFSSLCILTIVGVILTANLFFLIPMILGFVFIIYWMGIASK